MNARQVRNTLGTNGDTSSLVMIVKGINVAGCPDIIEAFRGKHSEHWALTIAAAVYVIVSLNIITREPMVTAGAEENCWRGGGCGIPFSYLD